ncbi:lysophospholipid acyltransferase family protein [Actinomyces mediterranea]|uniref:lysophospholipid acyltransferase family protein n=1 Tax=Actinomyces mediterranea TaxID=1871028 RepID=UPI000971312E|nr:lysophospholipid acyltransferase family protein [Actinomyces mediterranea]
MSSSVTGFYRFARAVLRPIMTPWVRIEALGTENIPESGPYLLVVNHISEVDPLSLCWYFMKRDVPVRFLAKKSMFAVPVFGTIISGMGLIPVDREVSPAQSLIPAVEALKGGEVVCIYPEGTLTREPDYWPMAFKTGAARLALDSGVPVIPVAQWGAHTIKSRYGSGIDMRPGRTMTFSFLPALDLSDLMSEAGSANHDAVNEATNRMHRVISDGVGELRGQSAPTRIWDPLTPEGPWWEHEGRAAAEEAARLSGEAKDTKA